MMWRCLFGAVSLLALSGEPRAAPHDYCRAYAIDFADLAERGTDWWQQRFENAQKACEMQFTFQAPSPERPAAAQETAARAPRLKKEKPLEVAAKAASVEAAAANVKSTVVRRRPNIKEGSAEWYDYCARKYVSFKRKTGTYTSRSGVERRCLVTADFQ